MKRILLIILLSVCFIGNSYANDDKLSDEAVKVLAVQEGDLVIGDVNAPVTLVEYASLSCSHCAEFHSHTLPLLKEKYVTGGKLKIVFRYFTRNAQDIKASALVECLDSNDRKERFIATLFKSIDKWATHTDFQEKLKKIAKVGGLKEEKFEACMADKKIEDKLLKIRLDATNILKVESTPTVFINGQKPTDRSNDGLVKLIDSLL